MSAIDPEAGRWLAGAAKASIDELRTHDCTPVRVRIHPADAEAIIDELFPDRGLGPEHLQRLWSLPVVLDELVYIGEPVAEFDP